MDNSKNIRKFSAFSVDAILASEGPRFAGRISRDRVALNGDGSLNSSSVDDVWLRQLFTDVTRRLLTARSAADTGQRSSTYSREEPGVETEQFTGDNSISTLTELSSLCPQSSPNSVGSWLEQHHRSIRHVRIPSPDRRTPICHEPRSRGCAEEELSVEPPAVGVDHSSRQTRRRAKLNMVDGSPQTPARNDVDGVSCYLKEESTSEADVASAATWLTRFHHDCPEARPPSHPLSRGSHHPGVQNDFGATWIDQTRFWRLAHPLTGE